MKFGQAIYNIRKEKQLSQEQFSELFNVSRQTISNWENNKSYPDLETIIKISEMFHISLDTLLKEDQGIVKNIDRTRKKNKVLFVSFIIVVLLASGVCFLSLNHKEVDETLSFQMNVAKDFINENHQFENESLSTGFFDVDKKGEYTLTINSSIDHGTLILEITNSTGMKMIRSEDITNVKTSKKITLDKGSYMSSIVVKNIDDTTFNIDTHIDIESVK